MVQRNGAWVQKHSVCGRRDSGILIVPIPQTACSAISRSFVAPLRDRMPFFNEIILMLETWL